MCKCASDFNQELGKTINKLRVSRKLSFGQLALKSGIDKSNLVKITKTGENVTQRTVFNIAKALRVPVIELYRFCSCANCLLQTKNS